MGKMTDALRKAKMLKERKEGIAPSSAPAAPIEEYVEPPKPAERPIEKPAPARRGEALRSPEPIEEPTYSIIEEEEVDAAPAVPDIESLPIIEETEEEPRAKKPPEPEPPKPVVLMPPEEEAPKKAPLVFETVEEKKPEAAPPPPPPPVEAKAPKVEVAPAPVPPALAVPEEPKKEEKPAAMAWSPESAPVRSAEIETEAPAAEPAPTRQGEVPMESGRSLVLPAVEPTPKVSRLPYMSVCLGRDERLTEEFRKLKLRLNEEGQARLIFVASSRPGEGKTTLALNLAASFANAYGERVVVVDGNVTRPKVAEVLEIGDGAAGLGRAVRGLVSAEEAAAKTEVPGLWVVRADAPGRGSEGLLDSDGMRTLLGELRRKFTRVIVEIPALEDLGEGMSLAAQADVVLVPVMRSKSRRKSVRRLVDTLKDRGAARVRCVFIDA